MSNVVGDGAAEDHAEQNRPDIDGNIQGNAQVPLKQPSRQFRQQHNHDKFCHAEQEESDPERYFGCKLSFHCFTTLYPTPRMVTILKSGLSLNRSLRRPICTSTVWVSVSELYPHISSINC